MAKVARYTFLYFVGNMAAAVMLGILLVSLVRPGRGQPLSSASSCLQSPGLDQVSRSPRSPRPPETSTFAIHRHHRHCYHHQSGRNAK